jgi:Response regulator receiver domain.
MQHILIADDNHDITDILSTYSRMEGFEPIVAYDGEEALRLFKEYNPEVVLLDVMMPKEDGYEVCRKIRSKSNVPVILITARGEDFDKIMGLDIGADDYIVKPFSPREVMARVRAVLRRIKTSAQNTSENVIKISNLVINLDEYSVHIGGKKYPLQRERLKPCGRWLLIRTKYLQGIIFWTAFGDSIITATAGQWIPILRDFVQKLMRWSIPIGP